MAVVKEPLKFYFGNRAISFNIQSPCIRFFKYFHNNLFEEESVLNL